MKRGAQAVAVAAVVAMLGLLVWKVASDDGGVAAQVKKGVPATAPEFSLPRLNGEGEISLSSLRGKAVAINFWASWCIPCKEEAPLLERTWRKYRDRGLVVLGVDAEDFKGDARRFVRRYDLTYPIVFAREKSVIADYGLTGYPETFFVARDGRVVAHVAGEVEREELEQSVELALES